MREELDKELVNKYPKIFSEINFTEIHNGWFHIIDKMCNLIQRHIDNSNNSRIRIIIKNRRIKEAIENNNNILVLKELAIDLFGHLDSPTIETFINNPESFYEIVPNKVEQVVASQIKEKFGSLCFYYSGGDDFVDAVIRMAEEMSDVTCEFCGSPGELDTSKGWVQVKCKMHKNQ